MDRNHLELSPKKKKNPETKVLRHHWQSKSLRKSLRLETEQGSVKVTQNYYIHLCCVLTVLNESPGGIFHAILYR